MSGTKNPLTVVLVNALALPMEVDSGWRNRTKFFTYQLYLEYFKKHANDLTSIPEETTSRIYDYFAAKYQLDDIDDYKLEMLTCQWIEIDGKCIDPDDPGIYPLLS
ncbi:hypothetical protein NQ318_003354 [Aromia moschata]|uniref:Uncharacterized protein n=1 Tax=Aromia moschata TaxID=1265417 RepID=A0AAV8YAX5_9CUCU|nr:hypothetical protein NQ318_003354 [Aromia moschata]